MGAIRREVACSMMDNVTVVRTVCEPCSQATQRMLTLLQTLEKQVAKQLSLNSSLALLGKIGLVMKDCGIALPLPA